eukprot:CAMPEP_0180511518 /NCGR_PEP_ID=MMETSP1036_2-20121128/51045_1 /TAXON_ID=632150 /ORGANISM="Azadinium spinosum, Strain 3D9" /LENGTH=76 /DNA_ID=CAMNT_0022522491 /DNA_START=119 /DNA_END=350 /DNA_ORIENTATION=-
MTLETALSLKDHAHISIAQRSIRVPIPEGIDANLQRPTVVLQRLLKPILLPEHSAYIVVALTVIGMTVAEEFALDL